MAGKSYEISADGVAEVTTVAGTRTVKALGLTLPRFLAGMGDLAQFETGLLPVEGSGVLSIRKFLDHTQIVAQIAPRVSPVFWRRSDTDYDPKAKRRDERELHNVAMPYRIWIGDIVEATFIGARHFYSPSPISSLNDILYHTNLPNTNCLGYNDTSVGWICLYINALSDFSQVESLAHAVALMEERCGTGESYNDNMTETDGPTFYSQYHTDAEMGKRLTNISQWEAYTDKHGEHWTSNDGVWIPVKVKGPDDQFSHDPNGMPLTLEMAMKGEYAAKYSDEMNKPINVAVRQDRNPDDLTSSAWSQLDKTVAAAEEGFPERLWLAQPQRKRSKGTKAKTEFLAPTSFSEYAKCKHCGTVKERSEKDFWFTSSICVSCREKYYGTCHECTETFHFEQLQFYKAKEQYFCSECATIYECQNCGFQTTGDVTPFIYEGQFCTNCAEVVICTGCGQQQVNEEGHVREVEAPAVIMLDAPGEDGMAAEIRQETMYFCLPCAANYVACACGFVKETSEVMSIPDCDALCGSCVGHNPKTGVPKYVQDPEVRQLITAFLNKQSESAVQIDNAGSQDVVEEEIVIEETITGNAEW
jgi:hypothetical protein